jgi:voltage-gated potassium channel Kch
MDFDKHIYRVLLGATMGMIALGTVVYHFLEHLTWVNAYYFSVITLTTVGYGDITPKTDAAKIFTTFYIFAGVGIITTFISYSLRRRTSKISKNETNGRE